MSEKKSIVKDAISKSSTTAPILDSKDMIEVDSTSSISDKPVTKDNTVDKSEGEMKSGTSATIRESAKLIFQSDTDNRFAALDIAYNLFSDFQDVPVTSKTSIKLTKGNVRTYLELAGIDKIEVNHSASIPKRDKDGNVILDKNSREVMEWETVQSRVENSKFKTLSNDVFAFTQLVAVTDKFSERDKLQRNSTRLLNRLCRHKIVEEKLGKETIRYEFDLVIKPIKDFVRICFADKSNAGFFANCIDKSKQQIGQVISSIVQVVSNPKLNAIEKYGMKSAPKASGTEMFNKTIGMLQNDSSSKLDILVELKKLFPVALAELELPQAGITQIGSSVESIAAG